MRVIIERGEMIVQREKLVLMEAGDSGQRGFTEWMGFEQKPGRKTVIKTWILWYPGVVDLAMTSDNLLFYLIRKVRPREPPWPQATSLSPSPFRPSTSNFKITWGGGEKRTSDENISILRHLWQTSGASISSLTPEQQPRPGRSLLEAIAFGSYQGTGFSC